MANSSIARKQLQISRDCNTAVIYPFAYDYRVGRIASITEDGKAIVRDPLDSRCVRVESYPRQFPVIGVYVQQEVEKRFWFFWKKKVTVEKFLPLTDELLNTFTIQE